MAAVPDASVAKGKHTVRNLQIAAAGGIVLICCSCLAFTVLYSPTPASKATANAVIATAKLVTRYNGSAQAESHQPFTCTGP
jgi:hypothetical protein